ncbi:MAG: signal peptidase [Thermosediminibacterales bacterium]|nr:signal peptidase [Thermosediminibacterales bacterium]MDK2836076.1 signal peptidase [Thermosediminibacterales bacterium]
MYAKIKQKVVWEWDKLEFFFVIVFLVLIDQISKSYIQKLMSPNESIPIIKNLFHITYVKNYGAAFGVLKHRTTFFVFISVLIVIIILVYMQFVPKNKKALRFAFALQIGGALGNLLDRIRLSYVVDFLDLRIWPVFNIADMAIVFGVGILIYEIVFNDKKSLKPS